MTTTSAPRAGTAPSATPRWAALDIGSDTIHLLIADVRRGPGGRLTARQVTQRSALLELGREVALHGAFERATVKALQATVDRFVTVARRADARLVVAATEAAREASNGATVLARLEKAAGTPPRIISGAREAALGFLAVRTVLPRSGTHLLVDSGGASTETSLVVGHRLTASASLPVGAALLAASVPGDPPRPLPWALAAIHIAGVLGSAPVGRPTRLFATGGTAHNLAGLDGDRKGHPLPVTLSIDELDRLTARLLRSPAAKIARSSGEDPRRVALLAPGALILGAIAQHYGLESITVVPEGVRDGMILAAARDPDGWWQDQPSNA